MHTDKRPECRSERLRKGIGNGWCGAGGRQPKPCTASARMGVPQEIAGYDWGISCKSKPAAARTPQITSAQMHRETVRNFGTQTFDEISKRL
jgi:hypothetical protein